MAKEKIQEKLKFNKAKILAISGFVGKVDFFYSSPTPFSYAKEKRAKNRKILALPNNK